MSLFKRTRHGGPSGDEDVIDTTAVEIESHDGPSGDGVSARTATTTTANATVKEPTGQKSGIRAIDLADETIAGVLAKPARAALTTLGTVLGLASLVATMGISRTAGEQIVGRFDELQATQVIVTTKSVGRNGALPWSVEERLDRLNGVVASGAVADVRGTGPVKTLDVNDRERRNEHSIPMVAASVGVLDAVRGHIAAGRWFDHGHVARGDRVVILGDTAAAKLQIRELDGQPSVYIQDKQYTVIGIIDEALRDEGLTSSIIVPSTVAANEFNVDKPERIVVETDLGAARMIAGQVSTALRPNAPESLTVVAPPDPEAARAGVENDLNGMFLLLGLISLIVGAIGIANVTLVTVMERTGEIGLRRALGARRVHIAGQFLAESAAMGLVGGIIGASVGILTIVGVAASRGWTPILDPWIPLAAPFAGALIGLLAGLYPSMKAARMEPVDALRGGV